MDVYDSVVIGAGPGGMTAALYLCRFGLRTAMLEKLTPGGQMLSTFEIGNYPGFPEGTPGWNLADNLAAHLKGYALDHFAREALELRSHDNLHFIKAEQGEIASRTVIVCSGAKPRKLGLADEERLTGRGVSYCAMCDGMFFKNKVVAVVGGGNAAIEEALHLSNLVQKLYLVHRRDDFRADKVYRDKLAHHMGNIELVMGYVVESLNGGDSLTGITIAPTGGGAPRILDVSGMFVFIGTEPANTFLPPGVETDEYGFIVTDCEMRTGIPGLYAAGDIRSKRCRQVVTAVGDGATAANAVFEYLERMPED